MARSLFSGEAFFPRRIFLTGVGLAAASTQGFGALLPDSMNRAGWLEVGNKLSAYRMFASVDSLLKQSSPAEAFELTRKMDQYQAVWAMEGLGYYYAQRGGGPRTRQAQGLPRRVRVPLHTGAALAWAEAALRSAQENGIEHAVRDFWERCQIQGQDGYAEALFEALGLVASTLYPNLVAALARHSAEVGDEQSDLFWHGVGRGLYFSPAGFLPLSEARNHAYSLSQRLSSTEAGRRNCMAGLTWAMTLVNIRDPEVLESCLRDCAQQVRLSCAFRNGMTSALIVWLSASPEDRYVDALGRFQLADRDPFLRDLWDGTVRQACQDARRLVSTSPSGDLAAQVFRMRPLSVGVNGGNI